MKYEDLTLKQIQEIKNIQHETKSIMEWKIKMHAKAVELGLTDREIIDANRSNL